MKTPHFWYTPPSFLANLLFPLGWLYGKGAQLLRFLHPERDFSIPLISIGNLVSGGAGKTPVALALAKLLQKRGYKVHFVTRGYKGLLQGPLKVNPSLHSPKEVGDEAFLLAEVAPTWIAKKRFLGIQEAIAQGATLIILDDGHQTSGIKKTLSFIVVDLLQRFGNGYVLPAGPLRENLSAGLARADALIGVGEGEITLPLPFFKAQTVPQPFDFKGKKVLAFCGLGYPQKFYQSLKKAKVTLVQTQNFPDHHRYTEKDLLDLAHRAQTQDAVLVTTSKDWVKLSAPWKEKISCFKVDTIFDSPEKLCAFIEENLKTQI